MATDIRPKTSDEIELLELIAELNMSDDKSRQALGAEIKRLTTALRTELAALAAERERLAKELSLYRQHSYSSFVEAEIAALRGEGEAEKDISD